MSFFNGFRLREAAKLPHFLRSHTEFWVLTRCVAHGADALQKACEYAKAVNWHKFLLCFERMISYFTCPLALADFCGDRRGSWWDRLCLNQDVHLKDRVAALADINKGCADALVRDKDRLLLQV